MNGKIEYLEKYSVAPSPSRDYYGIRVLQDEIILFSWKISHGPHFAPIVRVCKFSEFEQERSLQDEIRHVFGEPLLQHVRNIAFGRRNTLLTLPKSVIEVISRYLTLKDIVKLSSLSHAANEVFSADGVWALLYKRHKRTKVCQDEIECGQAYGWKWIFKERRQMHVPAKDRKANRERSGMEKRGSDKTDLRSARSVNVMPKSSMKLLKSAKVSTGFRNVEDRRKSLELLTKEDIELKDYSMGKASEINIECPGNFDVEENITLRNEGSKGSQSLAARTNNRMEMDDSQKLTKLSANNRRGKDFSKVANEKSSTGIVKAQSKKGKNLDLKSVDCKLYDGKAKSQSTIIAKVKPKCKTNVNERNVKLKSDKVGNIDKCERKQKIDRSKIRERELFNANALIRDKKLISELSSIGDNKIDLSDLVEASMKKFRNPRSIFDVDFSALEENKIVENSIKEIGDVEVEASRSTEWNGSTFSYDRSMKEETTTSENAAEEAIRTSRSLLSNKQTNISGRFAPHDKFSVPRKISTNGPPTNPIRIGCTRSENFKISPSNEVRSGIKSVFCKLNREDSRSVSSSGRLRKVLCDFRKGKVAEDIHEAKAKGRNNKVNGISNLLA